MREYKTILAKDGTRLRKISKWIKIRYHQDGSPFFIFKQTRYNLDDVMRLSYPIFFDNEDGKTSFLSGYLPLYGLHALLFEIDDCGEFLRVYYEVEK